MHRRDFLLTGAGLVGAAAAVRSEPEPKPDRLKDFKITRITGFRHVCPRPKMAGKNARLDVHGRQTSENVLLLETDQNVTGVGVGTATQEAARKLLGHSLAEYWKSGVGVVSPLGRADHALYDLVGKALGVPSWKLFGGHGPEWVPVYDGSVYFNDLLPEFESQGVKRLLEEVETGLKEGHRAFKIKVGRGHKWMEKEAGFRRDVEVVQGIRKLVGKDVTLMVDANNGMDLDGTLRWLDAVGDELFFVEEMFPEQVEQDLRLKDYLHKKGWKTRVADGESAREVDHFNDFIAREAIDVYQPDIRAFGLTLQWEMSKRLAAKPALRLAPHNWGSFLGLYMQLVLGRGVGNMVFAEVDPSRSDLFDTVAFRFREGKIQVPEVPGCGLVLREDVLKEKYRQGAWTVAAE